MEATWKIDAQNSGACYSTAKEISKIQPDFATFLSDYLVSDPKSLSSSELYSFMLKLFSATFKQISAQQVETSSLKNSLVQQKALLQEECEKRAQLEQFLASKPENSLQKSKIPASKPASSDSSSFYMNLKLAITSAIKIQSHWKGFSERKKYKKKIHEIINQPNPRSLRNLSNKEIMQTIASAVEKKGLTLEQSYRAADIDCDGKLSFEELMKFFNDLKINLPKFMISKFMLIVDENCSGVIEKQEFLDALTAYKVSNEDHWKSDRTYEEEVLLKFVKFMDSRGIEAEELFNLCDTDETGAISLKELEKYLLGLKAGFQVKEVQALMLRLDTDKSGELTLEEFQNHLSHGQVFFQQEKLAGTNSMMPVVVSNEIAGLRDLVKTLEFKGSVLSLLDSIQNYPNKLITVAKFYDEVNKCFACKISKQQCSVFNKAITLNDSGMISFDSLKPFLLFYSSRALKTKENYLMRVRMHPAPNGKKIYDRENMTTEWFFTAEQCDDILSLYLNQSDNIRLNNNYMEIRTAQLKDLQQLTEFNINLAKETENKDLDFDLVQQGVRTVLENPSKGTYYVAEIEQQIAGGLMITFQWVDWKANYNHFIQSVYTKKEFRGIGIFKALFHYVKAKAELEGLSLRLYVDFDNERAIEVYKRLGMNHTNFQFLEIDFAFN